MTTSRVRIVVLPRSLTKEVTRKAVLREFVLEIRSITWWGNQARETSGRVSGKFLDRRSPEGGGGNEFDLLKSRPASTCDFEDKAEAQSMSRGRQMENHDVADESGGARAWGS